MILKTLKPTAGKTHDNYFELVPFGDLNPEMYGFTGNVYKYIDEHKARYRSKENVVGSTKYSYFDIDGSAKKLDTPLSLDYMMKLCDKLDAENIWYKLYRSKSLADGNYRMFYKRDTFWTEDGWIKENVIQTIGLEAPSDVQGYVANQLKLEMLAVKDMFYEVAPKITELIDKAFDITSIKTHMMSTHCGDFLREGTSPFGGFFKVDYNNFISSGSFNYTALSVGDGDGGFVAPVEGSWVHRVIKAKYNADDKIEVDVNYIDFKYGSEFSISSAGNKMKATFVDMLRRVGGRERFWITGDNFQESICNPHEDAFMQPKIYEIIDKDKDLKGWSVVSYPVHDTEKKNRLKLRWIINLGTKLITKTPADFIDIEINGVQYKLNPRTLYAYEQVIAFKEEQTAALSTFSIELPVSIDTPTEVNISIDTPTEVNISIAIKKPPKPVLVGEEVQMSGADLFALEKIVEKGIQNDK